MKIECEYHVATAEASDPAGAALELEKAVNLRMQNGFEPMTGMGIIPILRRMADSRPGYELHYVDQTRFHAYQAMYRVNRRAEKVTTSAPGAAAAVTHEDDGKDCIFLRRETPDWESAWAALAGKVPSVDEFMLMYSKINKHNSKYYDHSFKHVNTRDYITVAAPRTDGGPYEDRKS